MHKACVFVDGENLRHSIVELFSDCFHRGHYLPTEARWADFFDYLVSESATPLSEARRLRTYWYVVEHLDFFPYRFPSAHKDKDVLHRLLSKDSECRKQLASLSDEPLIAEMQAIVDQLQRRKKSMSDRFEGWRVIQNGICGRWPFIEFRRAGGIRYNLFDRSLGPEKAVDVKLATDLIALKDIYDLAIIVSGDQDYVPAVQHVKDAGKQVVNVAFETRGGKLLPGGARRLNQLTDTSVVVKYAKLKDFMCL